MSAALRIFAAGAFVTLCACGLDDNGPKGSDVVSMLTMGRDTARIATVDTVPRGAFFTISFTTYAGGCFTKGETKVGQTASGVMLMPYDHYSGGEVCDRMLRIFVHAVAVVLYTPGPATIRLVGVGDDRQPLELTRSVFVR
jgi:hypothetical protein